jgi:type II secretory pathway pseudopilin PulG
MEMLAVIAIGSTMMAITTSALYLFVKTEGQGRQAYQQQTSLARLADQFRRDVHAAQGMTRTDGQTAEQAAWKFETGERQAVEYLAGSGGIARLETDNGKIRRQEWYPLAEPWKVTLESKREEAVQMVSLRIAALPSAGHKAPGTPLRVDARLAADHRFGGAKPASAAAKEETP